MSRLLEPGTDIGGGFHRRFSVFKSSELSAGDVYFILVYFKLGLYFM